ncbi:MAG: Holliday junction resolvase RuvX [Ruminococcus sp.]|nr:Holliday junction resolvase RuvX [Ruminococcus sp.]
MRIMSVDFGDSRTGIAVCDRSELLASPLTVIFERSFEKCAEKTAQLAKDEGAELIVVGFPKNMNNTVGTRAELCVRFGEEVKKKCGIDVVMWDERCTTVSAHNYLNEVNVRGKKRRNVVDAVAAVIILENYLDYRKNTSDIQK